MYLQNEDGLLPIIKELGCYFLSLGRIIELETDKDFAIDEVNEVWRNSIAHKYIDDDKRIINPDKILKNFTLFTKQPHLTIAQIGEEKNGKIVYWNWTKPFYQNANYLIDMVNTNGKQGTHFRLCNIDKKVIFDSYSFEDYSFKPSGRYLHYMIIK